MTEEGEVIFCERKKPIICSLCFSEQMDWLSVSAGVNSVGTAT